MTDHQHEHGQACPHTHGSSEGRTLWAAIIIGAFMVVEVIGGLWSGSLALLADAGHMLSDFASLVLAFFAFRLARRPADHKRSFGYERAQILAAFVNGLTLLAIACWIVVEAIQRLLDPGEIMGLPMLIIACIGLVVNIVAFAVLTVNTAENVNLRAAAAHVMADLLGSVAAVAAAVGILWTGIVALDPILSVVVAALVARSGVSITRETAHVLLEGTPSELNVKEVSDALASIEGVDDVHHLHVWSLTDQKRLATVHLLCRPDMSDGVRQHASAILDDRFGIGHPTIQIEFTHCESQAVINRRPGHV